MSKRVINRYYDEKLKTWVSVYEKGDARGLKPWTVGDEVNKLSWHPKPLGTPKKRGGRPRKAKVTLKDV